MYEELITIKKPAPCSEDTPVNKMYFTKSALKPTEENNSAEFLL